MATMNLGGFSGTLDEETGTVTLHWIEGCPDNNPDPVSWRPTQRVSLVLPGVAEVTPLFSPTVPEIEALSTLPVPEIEAL